MVYSYSVFLLAQGKKEKGFKFFFKKKNDTDQTEFTLVFTLLFLLFLFSFLIRLFFAYQRTAWRKLGSVRVSYGCMPKQVPNKKK